MPWKAMEVQDQRVRFVVEAAKEEKPLSWLCAEYGISRPTGYQWLRRYREQGVAGVVEGSHRPKHSPKRTAAELEQRVVELRQRYPDWGARKLGVLLARQQLRVPATTIHRILLRHGLVREVDQHRAATRRFERKHPNELWQMDFKGGKHWPQAQGPLSVIDDHSRYLIQLAETPTPDGKLVRKHLEQAFERCGLPEAMLMDHGVPWWNWQSFSGSTQLSLWLMRQGIKLCWSGIRHPQTQGKVERFHGNLERALVRRGSPEVQLQMWLDHFRYEHNHIRPHEALQMRTPVELWQRSPRAYHSNPPDWEYASGAWTLKVDCHGTIDIHGDRWRIAKSLVGQRVLVQPVDQRYLIFYCNTLVRELDPATKRSTIVERFIANSSPRLSS